MGNKDDDNNVDTIEEDEEDPDFSGVGYCHPAHNCHRYFFLIFMCSLGIGNYFCYDAPASLQQEMMDTLKITTTEYGLLYTLYSWPNTVLSLFGGLLVDRVLGIKLGAIIFACFTFSGQFVLGLGAYMDKFWLMCVGRLLFAIGGENLAVTANMRAVKWFKGRELNMVLGLQLSIARAGSTINMNVMKPIYDWLGHSYSGYQQLGVALMLASVVAGYDLVIGIVLAIRDTWAEKKLKIKEAKSEDKISPKDVKEFHLDYWTITAIIMFYYMTIFPFVSFGVLFFARKFKFNATDSRTVNSIVYMISMGASPILGALMGRLGRNLIFVLIAVLITMGAHALMAFTFLTPWVGMSCMGIGYSLLACTVWAMVSLVVPERTLGTAYGLTQALQNLGLGIIPLAVGPIIENKGYICLEILFLALLCVTVICIMILFVLDENRGGYLNMTPSERVAFDEKKTNIKSNDLQNLDNMGVDGVYSSKSTQL